MLSFSIARADVVVISPFTLLSLARAKVISPPNVGISRPPASGASAAGRLHAVLGCQVFTEIPDMAARTVYPDDEFSRRACMAFRLRVTM